SIEGIEKHPGRYLRGVTGTVWRLLKLPVYGPLGTDTSRSAHTGRARSIVVDGRRLPKPSEGEPIPDAHLGNRYSTPDNRISVVWTSPSTKRLVFRHPHDQRRYRRLVASVDRLSGKLPSYKGSAALSRRLNQVSHRYPWPVIWLGVGIVAALIRRPRNLKIAAALALAALLVIVSTALGEPDVPEYAAPVVPALIFFGAVGLLGDRLPGVGWTYAARARKRSRAQTP